LRIALVASVLVLLAVGASVAVTAWLGSRIAARAAAEQLDLSHEVQRAFRDQRYQRLWLSSDLFALDPYLAAYVAEAAETADTASILDLLGQNQQQLGFDFAAVLTPTGRVLAHTERPDAPGEDLSGRPLVAKALEEYEASGVWAERDRLYDAVVVPVARGLDLGGFLLIGFRIDDELARGVREASRAEVAYFVRADDGYRQVGATLGEAEGRELAATLRARADEVARLVAGDDEGGRMTLDLGGRPWLALIAPLRDAAGEPVGVAATLSSLDQQLATYRRLQWLLTATGAVAILLAVGLAYPLSRRSLRPVRDLAEAAEAARRGDYDRRVGDAGGDEVGRLAATFDELLSSLREKRDMETYMSHLSLSLPEAAEAGERERPAPPAAEEVVLLAAELRRHGRSVGASGPAAEAAMAAFQHDVDRLTAAALAEGGRLEAVLGHRVLVSFAGASAAARALAVAVSVMAAARGESAEIWALPVVALAAGTAARGGVLWGEGARPAVVGRPAARIESLLRDASPGEVVFAPDVARSLEAVLGARGLTARAQTGLVSSQKIHALPVEELQRLGDLQGVARTVSLPDEGDEAREPAGRPPTAPVASKRLGVGSILGGRFEIVSVLGSGGMGMVYKARDRELSELVALKVLHSDSLDRGENRERLKDELRLARRITHPNVLRTYDFGDLDGVTFVSMEYVRGVTLRELLDGASEPLPFRAALRLSRQVAAGLAAAHELGVVHRDVKPENVILDPAGNARVMDFGIARTVAEESAYTRAGQVVGTPHYIAPERLRSEPADARSDVYSLGVMLFEVFAGEPPFPGGTLPQIVSQHLYDPPPPVRSRRSEIPEELEAILLRCLAKTPEARFADAGAVLAALDRVHG
jgi:serine/threonine-protein kinase